METTNNNTAKQGSNTAQSIKETAGTIGEKIADALAPGNYLEGINSIDIDTVRPALDKDTAPHPGVIEDRK